MRKVLLLVLILGAIGVYVYDALLLVHTQKPGEEPKIKEPASVVSLDKLLADAKPVEFTVKGRDPFTQRKVDIKPVLASSSSSAQPSHGSTSQKQPLISITGIMWNPASPIAMITLPDGSSGVAKPGQVFGEITVKKIEKTRIQVVFQKKEFWISQ
jgi:hypothetical protein